MKLDNLIKYRERKSSKDTNLKQLVMAVRVLMTEILELRQSFSWLEKCKNRKWGSIREAENSYIGNMDRYKRHVDDYRILLREYVSNHNFYEDNSLQDKFLNGEILKIRELAERGLGILNNLKNSSRDIEIKRDIQETINNSRDVINEYFEILRKIQSSFLLEKIRNYNLDSYR